MSSFALPGGRGPACPDLPPTLLPHAIAAAAPPRERMRSLMLSGAVYLALAEAGLLASRTKPPLPLPPMARTDPPPRIYDCILPPPSPEPVRAIGPRGPAVPAAPLAAPGALPLPRDPVAVPGGLPTRDLSGVQSTGDPRGTRPAGDIPSSGTEAAGAGGLRAIDVSALRILRQVAPGYPPMARLAHVQGVVVLQMTIDAQGVPTDVQVVQGPPAFREAAVHAARQWRFEPARVEGRAVAATFRLTLDFRLR